MGLRFGWFAAVATLVACGAQVIDFEAGGLRYKTLSKEGLTVMFAPLPGGLRDYSIVQAGVMNGSAVTFTIRPEDFSFYRADGTVLKAQSARSVVDSLLARAGRNDVIKLISTYELGINGVQRFRSTNGFEYRRQAALAELGSNRFKAAAAASAIAFVPTKLASGESTDGALFFSTGGKPLGLGRLVARASGVAFEFEVDPDASGKSLQQRPAQPSPN
jgi:hypothetical protein